MSVENLIEDLTQFIPQKDIVERFIEESNDPVYLQHIVKKINKRIEWIHEIEGCKRIREDFYNRTLNETFRFNDKNERDYYLTQRQINERFRQFLNISDEINISMMEASAMIHCYMTENKLDQYPKYPTYILDSTLKELFQTDLNNINHKQFEKFVKSLFV